MADLTGGETFYDYDSNIQNADQIEVLNLFQTLRDTPFKNEGQREQMALLIHQLVKLDHIPEVRTFFKQLGRLLNDLGDNGIIDNSAPELEEAVKLPKWKRIFGESFYDRYPNMPAKQKQEMQQMYDDLQAKKPSIAELKKMVMNNIMSSSDSKHLIGSVAADVLEGMVSSKEYVAFIDQVLKKF